jgi:pimeloyl-ACP methyl ester carboxylesterase
MQKIIFLHYGPGGNSYVENKIFQKLTNMIKFWDQPSTKKTSDPFLSLVNISEQEIAKIQSPSTIVAHSFGCDIAASIVKSNSNLVSKIVLISPLRNIPKNFIHLATNLLKKQDSEALTAALASKEFWSLVIQISTHPEYNSSFWYSAEKMANYFALAAKAPAFDPEEWQTIMNDYLFIQKQNDFQIFKNTNTQVVFGAQDPYLSQEDFEYWKELLGNENVTIIENVGHFPHIEQPSSILNLLN